MRFASLSSLEKAELTAWLLRPMISISSTYASTLFGFFEDVTLASYVPKRDICILMLTTLHHDNNLDQEIGDKMKTEVITFYNVTKGGVDSASQLCGKFNVARNTRRWPMVFLYGVLNTACMFCIFLLFTYIF